MATVTRIATAAKLDALPVGSVVRNESRGLTAERIDSTHGAVIGNAIRFDWHDLWSPGSLFIVLYRPDRPTPVQPSRDLHALGEAIQAEVKAEALEEAARIAAALMALDIDALVEQAARAASSSFAPEDPYGYDNLDKDDQAVWLQEARAALPVIVRAVTDQIRAVADSGALGFWGEDNHGASSPERRYGGWIEPDLLTNLADELDRAAGGGE